jgi:NAD(P)-dependent dehydrogenase (short-subunit alcohol dehydrogenase family)
MRRILVTGANKGIGLAIVEAILREHEDTFVFLGARDPVRGERARVGLLEARPEWEPRVRVVELDVTRDASVRAAAGAVAGAPLYAVVNNAGIGRSAGGMKAVLDVNTFGLRRVCEGFLPLLDPSCGRIVNVTSASGPSFVARCSEERRRLFTDPRTDWPALVALMDECLGLGEDAEAFAARGLGDGDAYGLSKACANAYTQHLALEHPNLRINACTPGFIETDMTRPYADVRGESPAALGMKPPEEGARCPLFLLFGEPDGNGRFYGSDAKRSPLDRYRSPGSPAYTGD